MTDTAVEHKVKVSIIDRLGLDIEPKDVDNAAPIFASLADGTEYAESSLNLDSIDILEVVLALSDQFAIDIPDDQPEIFTSIATLAEFVDSGDAVAQAE